MKISEHANYLLNEFGRLQFDYAAYCKPYGESLRNEARNNLEEYIAELEACPFCGGEPIVDSNGVVWCPCFHESVETWNKRSNRAKTLSEISGEIVIDAEMKAVGQAFVKEFYQMQYQIQSLKYRSARAERMVERLIEAGERLSVHSRMVDDIDVWNALVAEWPNREERKQ